MRSAAEFNDGVGCSGSDIPAKFAGTRYPRTRAQIDLDQPPVRSPRLPGHRPAGS